jgi:Rieske Fe-S protein
MVVTDAAGASDEEGTVLAPPARGRARLELRESNGHEQEIVLVKPEMTVGRSSGCDIVLQSPTVSRVHARIVQQNAGCLLIPVGARHNTFVNDEFVSQPRLLHDGDRIQLANERMVFRFDEGAARPSQLPSRRRPMLLAFTAALGAAALIFFVWRQTHPSPAIPIKEEPDPAEVTAAQAKQVALEQQARQEAERRRREEEVHQAAQRREEEARLRQEEEARQIEAQVRKNLYEGDVAFLEKRYTTPPDGSAVFAYREALRLDPSNERALSQTGKIIEEYLSWAETAAAQGRRSQARTYYDKASYVRDQIPSAANVGDIIQRLDALRRSLEADE